MTPPRCIIILDDNAGAAAWRSDCGVIATPPPPGGDDWRQWLQHQGDCLFSLLVDSSEEIYAVAAIPPLRGGQRLAAAQRRMTQLCRGARYAGFLSLGREAGRWRRRRDEKMLFFALAAERIIAPWMEALSSAGALVDGVYAMAQLHQYLSPAPPPPLLITIAASRSGLRLSFFVAGRLHYSRLFAAAAAPSLLAADVDAALAAMREQLLRQRLLDAAEQPLLLVLADEQQFDALAANLDRPGLALERANAASLIATSPWRRLTTWRGGRRDDAAALDAAATETFFCRLLAQRPPPQRLAAAAEIDAHRRWRQRRAWRLAIAGSCCGVAALFAVLFASPPRPALEAVRIATPIAPESFPGDPLVGNSAAPAAARATPAPPPPQTMAMPAAPLLRLNGVVLRSQGPSTLWINGQPQGEGAAPAAGWRIDALRRADAVTLRRADEAPLQLKVGADLNTQTRTISGALAAGEIVIHQRRKAPARP